MVIRPILSIVIPTKNRYEYLIILLQSLLSTESGDFEIIIQDNSDDNTSFELEIGKYKGDKRLKYYYTPGWLSVVDNCDLGVGNASGRFVSLLGDDDGILVDLSIKFLYYLEKNGFDAALVNKAEYYWPDTSHAVWGSKLSGKLMLNSMTGNIKELNPSLELQKILKEGASRSLGLLPRVYHGFVSKHVLDELKTKAQSYFPGPSPDIANAVGLTPFIKRYVHLDSPLVISGHSTKSTGGQGGQKLHHGKIENQSHLPKDTLQKWSKSIPLFWSGATIYAQSAYQALLATENIYRDRLDLSSLYAHCLVFESKYNEITLKLVNKSFSMKMKVYFKVFKLFIFRVFNFLRNMIKYRFGGGHSYSATDISTTQLVLNDLLIDEGKGRIKFN